MSSKLVVKQKEPKPNKKPRMTIPTNTYPPPAHLPVFSSAASATRINGDTSKLQATEELAGTSLEGKNLGRHIDVSKRGVEMLH